eukprot:gene10189-biopygen1643
MVHYLNFKWDRWDPRVTPVPDRTTSCQLLLEVYTTWWCGAVWYYQQSTSSVVLLWRISSSGITSRVVVLWRFPSSGGPGSGANWHTHGPTWCFVVRGAKRWLLYHPSMLGVIKMPPYNAIPDALREPLSPSRPRAIAAVRRWARDELPALCTVGGMSSPPISFLQRAGEIVYLPGLWAHATVMAY